MKITGLIWLNVIVDKLDWKHHLFPDEVEQVFANSPQYRFLERGKIGGEHVYAAYGRTDAGRYVIVIFIRKAGAKALIISARDMDKRERKQYGR
ncbi:MAG: BrnT family toxin [Chloroflexi bacterium]|nr:BrnT family toxin [Chloroflexota bacterium]